MNPISSPLIVVYGNLVGKGLTRGYAALSDANGTVVPRRAVEKYAMVVQRSGFIERISRVKSECIRRTCSQRRRTGRKESVRGTTEHDKN
jgi:hypothetical protein